VSNQEFWPDGNQCAVVVTVNFDAESVDRKDVPEGALWGRYAFGRYGAQIGAERILDALDRYGITATFFIPGYDAERYPDVMERIAGAGHEIGGHGYLHENFSNLSADEQSAVFERSEKTLEEIFGSKPAGWRAPGGLMTSETRSLLIERGYQYDSSFCDDDVPYLVEGGNGGTLAELPVFNTASDKFYYEKRRIPSVVSEALREEFSSVYEVGGLFNLVLHPRGDYGSGRGVRMAAVHDLLQEIGEYPRVWMTTCGELAAWMHERAGELKTWPA
jgi:peptidoglycan/xylan/chitin deacetylase (PgdA/CDA1 family)